MGGGEPLTMTAAELDRAIDTGQFPPLLFLYGEEQFLLEKTLKRLLDKALPQDARDFNLTVFHHKEFSAARLLDTVQTYPVFSQRRVVIVKGAHQIAAAELESLQSYLHHPVDETLLIFVGEKIDARRKFFLDFKKLGELVEFKKLYDNQLPAAIRDLARQNNMTLTDAALTLFCRRVGTNLQEVQTELVKLSLYLGENKLADAVDVDAVVTGSRQETVFALCDAIGDRQSVQAIEMVGRILDEGLPALVVLNMVTRHMRNLCKVGEMVGQKHSKAEIARTAGVNPYFLEGLIRQSRNFSGEQIRKIFERLIATDVALKSAAAHPAAMLEELVLCLCVE